MEALAGWDNFNVILGSGAGALIGLQFVVITLIAERPGLRMAEASAAFATPTIVHFGVVLLLSALTSAPWQGIGGLAAFWAVVASAGILYSIIVALRMKRQRAYEPVLTDWLCHLGLPLVAYSLLATAAFEAATELRLSMFAVAAGMLILLYVGIHNAWDAVTYHLFVRRAEKSQG